MSAIQGGGGLQSAVWSSTTTTTANLPSGHRVETTVTTASDAPAVTNSISTYDLLGRLLSTATPGENGAWLATSNAVWRVETVLRLTGSTTNAVQTRRTLLTGLSGDGLRSRVVDIPESGVATTTRLFDSERRIAGYALTNALTNAFTANCLNQYSAISTLCGSAPLRLQIQERRSGDRLPAG